MLWCLSVIACALCVSALLYPPPPPHFSMEFEAGHTYLWPRILLSYRCVTMESLNARVLYLRHALHRTACACCTTIPLMHFYHMQSTCASVAWVYLLWQSQLDCRMDAHLKSGQLITIEPDMCIDGPIITVIENELSECKRNNSCSHGQDKATPAFKNNCCTKIVLLTYAHNGLGDWGHNGLQAR